MITIAKTGCYKLIETKRHTKVLYLDKDAFAWVEPKNIGEILVVARRNHRTDCVLSVGDYKIYKVVDEPSLVDNTHLELEVGPGIWQGYLLLTGLPNSSKKRVRIIPTTEIITDNSAYNTEKESNREKAISV